jgi:lambda repressor-like predicted transcriptional regulator
MPPKQSIEASRQAIIDAMKARGHNFSTLSEELSVRGEKLAAAVKCSTGITPSAIKLRLKVAAALDLDPYEVWNEEYLTYVRRKSDGKRLIKVKAASELSKYEWSKLPPRTRVRALLIEKEMSLHDLQDELGVSYRMVTNAIYGAEESHDLRSRMSQILEYPIEDIWPDLYRTEEKPTTYMQKAASSEQMDQFYGFGNFL